MKSAQLQRLQRERGGDGAGSDNNAFNVDDELANNAAHGETGQQGAGPDEDKRQEEIAALIPETSPAYQLFTAFEANQDKEQPAQSYDQLSIENETKEVRLYDEISSKPLQISATGTSVMMFMLDCEELGSGSAALWGKVLTYANQSEVSQGYNWLRSKLQSGVIIVHGLEK